MKIEAREFITQLFAKKAKNTDDEAASNATITHTFTILFVETAVDER